MAVVGIDLGTTNTGRRLRPRAGASTCWPTSRAAACCRASCRSTRTARSSSATGAKERRVVDAKNTVASVKRLIGRAWDSEEIDRARAAVRVRAEGGAGPGPARGRARAGVHAARDQRVRPDAAPSRSPRRRSASASSARSSPCRRTSTSCSARRRRSPAASPGSTSCASSTSRPPRRSRTASGAATKERIAVYDFGGGTFDCTLLDLSGNVFEVLATAGDTLPRRRRSRRRDRRAHGRGVPAHAPLRPPHRSAGLRAPARRRRDAQDRALQRTSARRSSCARSPSASAARTSTSTSG